MGRRNHGGTSHVWKPPLMNRIDWIVGVIQPILKIIVYYVIHGRFFFFLSIQTILMSFQFNGRYIINTFAAHPQIKNFFSISQILRLVNTLNRITQTTLSHDQIIEQHSTRQSSTLVFLTLTVTSILGIYIIQRVCVICHKLLLSKAREQERNYNKTIYINIAPPVVQVNYAHSIPGREYLSNVETGSYS